MNFLVFMPFSVINDTRYTPDGNDSQLNFNDFSFPLSAFSRITLPVRSVILTKLTDSLPVKVSVSLSFTGFG